MKKVMIFIGLAAQLSLLHATPTQVVFNQDFNGLPLLDETVPENRTTISGVDFFSDPSGSIGIVSDEYFQGFVLDATLSSVSLIMNFPGQASFLAFDFSSPAAAFLPEPVITFFFPGDQMITAGAEGATAGHFEFDTANLPAGVTDTPFTRASVLFSANVFEMFNISYLAYQGGPVTNVPDSASSAALLLIALCSLRVLKSFQPLPAAARD